MTLDTLDHAFVARWERRMAVGVRGRHPRCRAGDRRPEIFGRPVVPGEHHPATADAPQAPRPPLADSRLVQRLLAAGPDGWAASLPKSRRPGSPATV